MTEASTKFPIDGYADTCVGYRRHHGADVLVDGLCGECARTLDDEISAERAAQAAQVAATMTSRCSAHPRGDHYYTCLACYGD